MILFVGMPEIELVVAGTGLQLDEYKGKVAQNIHFTGLLNKIELLDDLMKAKAVIVLSQ